MPSSFSLATRVRLPAEQLFDVSLSIADRVVLVPYLRRLIRRRNHHLLASLDAVPGTEPHLPSWPADGSSPFRRAESTALIGHGEPVWERATRVGFSYRTLPGHPVDGEEAFIVHRDGDDVFLTVRSLTAPAARQPWRALHPLLRIAQVIARRRYLRALR